MDKPDNETVRLAMELAWRDHHHARDQTWKAEKVLGAELIALVVAGRAVPTREVLLELATALGVKPTWLLGVGE